MLIGLLHWHFVSLISLAAYQHTSSRYGHAVSQSVKGGSARAQLKSLTVASEL
jgi:hypothetical protein